MVCDKCQEVIAMGYLHKEAIIISTFFFCLEGNYVGEEKPGCVQGLL